jgi:5-methylcytosine-specific restriction enzyme subunit McrC
MSQQLILKEYEFLQTKYTQSKNYITKKSFETLENFVLQNEETGQYLKLTSKKGFGKVLQAQNYVGLIEMKDGTSIEILPKIKNVSIDESKKILLKMLRTLKKSPFKNFNKAELKSSKMPLLEIFISMFLDELSLLVRKGIKNDYIEREENLHFLKGKLQVGKQIKHNSIHKERFFVAYEEFLSDRVENRLIKTTLEYLYKKSRYNHNQQKIREFIFVFDGVKTSQDIQTDFTKVKPNRQMRDYSSVLQYAKIFLFENSFSPYKGNTTAFALLFDMNLLFESYVGVYLKKKGYDVVTQDKGKYLVELPNKFALRPDFVLNKDTDKEIILDTKYKNISSHKDINQADMYQLYAYGMKYKKTKQLYLIYPKSEDITLERYIYVENELHLNVLFFDLTLGFQQELL